MPLNKLLNEIISLLEKETKCLEKILDFLIRQQDCLVKNDLKGLIEILSEKEDVVTSLSCLEKSRLENTVKLSACVKIPVSELTVNRISEIAEDDLKNRLQTAMKELRSLYDNIKKKRSLNQALIHQALEYTGNRLAFIRKVFGLSQTYSSDGDSQDLNIVPLRVNHQF